MTFKSMLRSTGSAAVLAAVALIASAQSGGPLIVLKDVDGNVRPDSIANLETLRELSTAPTGVRIWVTFTAEYEPDFLPGTQEFEKQHKKIEKIRQKLISDLEEIAPSSNDYEIATIGPHFAVVTDSNGIDFLISETKVTRIFGPA